MKDILLNTYLFKSFPEQDLGLINDMTHLAHYKSEHILFNQGQKFRNFYYICQGLVKLSRVSEQGDEKVIEIIREGQFFAEALMFLERPCYPVQATISKDSELFVIDSLKYIKVLKKSNATCFSMLGDMSQRIHQLVGEIEDLTLHSTCYRIASYLLKHVQVDKTSHVLDIPKNTIASRLSMKPETLSRALNHLKELGIIKNMKNEITILEIDSLKAYVKEEQEK